MYIRDLSKCCGCGACEQICPKHCITMISDEEGFWYPKIDIGSCIECRKCEQVCPFLDTKKQGSLKETYAAVYRNEEIRFHSSSGGLFSAISEVIEEKEGVIYGAYFSDDFKSVLHGKNSVKKLRTSKYVQSLMGNTYVEAENDLKQGKQVLFTGTPCQIAGLKQYLKVEYDNLLCIDVICHGVPSPRIWKKYLTAEEERNNAKTKYVNFRHKKLGGQQFKVNVKNESFEVYDSIEDNPYMNLFLKNYSLRPSCYQCVIKENGSFADLTLGDLWGIEKIASEMNDGRGISLVIIHTKRGEKWFEMTRKNLNVKKVDYDTAIQFNTPFFKSVTAPKDREAFFGDSITMSVAELAKKYCVRKRTVRERISKSAVGRFLKFLGGGQTSANEYGLYFLFEK